jgi:hypothetical protein
MTFSVRSAISLKSSAYAIGAWMGSAMSSSDALSTKTMTPESTRGDKVLPTHRPSSSTKAAGLITKVATLENSPASSGSGRMIMRSEYAGMMVSSRAMSIIRCVVDGARVSLASHVHEHMHLHSQGTSQHKSQYG